MGSWECVDHQLVPDDDGTLYLMAREGEFVIHINGAELMSDQLHGSEDALADLACDRLTQLDDARILVGGLGMGFTLAAALRRVGPEGRVTVAELMGAVVRWNETHTGKAAGFPLRDARASVYAGDVGDLVEDPPAPWSAILLDVDNGPRALTHPRNAWLYHDEGLATAWNALEPGGILGVWSAFDDESFTAKLRATGFEVEVIQFHEEERPTPEDDGIHVLWMCRRT